MTRLRTINPAELTALDRAPVDAATLAAAAGIVAEVSRDGEAAVRRYGERFDELAPGAPLLIERPALMSALDSIDRQQRALLERSATRIERFARAQRDALRDVEVSIEGGRAGHRGAPVERAGCYAPGGRYPLPSSVLMTAVTARVAGVSSITVATPHPGPIMLAAAAIAGADAVLRVGGAYAIAALAYGAGPLDAVDVIAGPGNRWVTAGKQLVCGQVGIDMLAGPSELVVLADDSADATLIAADLLAQAEHDPDAVPILVTIDRELAERVNSALSAQLGRLPEQPRAVAARALRNGFTVMCASIVEAIDACDRLAPEHLQLMTRDAEQLAPRMSHYGALFVGAAAGEVLGDYGAGPNHVLPTGGSARFYGGLSVLAFLRVRTWMQLDAASAADLACDASALARIEGLHAHAEAAERRLTLLTQ
jgi:phosphoribosyl-ATP pyrophosphohydrolase/phosphoribosyl-AMP cyclohydrolase/histidinol dehydrogenase